MKKIDLQRLCPLGSKKQTNNISKKSLSNEEKQAEASSLDAMSNYNRGFHLFKKKGQEGSSQDIKFLKNLSYTNSDKQEVKVFSKTDIENIEKDKTLVIDDDFKKRVQELLDISIKYEFGYEEHLFTYGPDIIKIAQNKDIAIDDDFKKRVLELSKLKQENRQARVFKDSYALALAGKDEETSKRTVELVNFKDKKGSSAFYIDSCIAQIAQDEDATKRAKEFASNSAHIANPGTFDYCALRISKSDDTLKRALELSNLKYNDSHYSKIEKNIFKNYSHIADLAEDKEATQHALSLANLKCYNGLEEVKRFVDEDNITSIAKDKDVTKRALELGQMTFENQGGVAMSMFTNEHNIGQIAKDKDATKRAIKLGNATYINNRGEQERKFYLDKNIMEISKSQTIYDMALELYDLKYSDPLGYKVRVFNEQEIGRLAKNEETMKKGVELANIRCHDSKDDETVFTSGDTIARIIEDKNFIVDDDFLKRAQKLAEMKFINTSGVEQRVFWHSNQIADIANDKELFDKIIKLTDIKQTNSKGKQEPVFTRADEIIDIANDTYMYNAIMDYIIEAKEKNLPFSSDIALSIGFGDVDKNQVKKLSEIYDKEKIESFDRNDLSAICNLINLYKINDINEISIVDKKDLLNGLITLNIEIFGLNSELQKDFPLIPKNQKEYCALLPQLVKSLGIEVKEISDEKIKEFNSDIFNLSDSLRGLSDSEFNNLEISQSYSREEFISDTIEVLGDLEDIEKQKVFDYFGFELKENENNETGYTISGYPANLNNGEKLSHIKDEKTKEVIEKLRPFVIQFIENNKIECNNSKVEAELNKIAEVLPEIRVMIGKSQHRTHSFDVLKHSLKVMQKISQNPQFDKLNEDDKKLMLLSSLLHDITKGEGYVDRGHASESAFDMYYIVKKLNLSRNDEIKLYTLSKNHEWLNYVNKKDLSEDEIEKRQKEVGFLLQQDNLFDMASIFTEADLKSVKDDDEFFNIFGNKLTLHGEKIKEYILELKKTQPILPTTKLPKSSEIKKNITKVNPDGSTNIKGVYQDSNGLIVLRYNEIENWEELGLPKGTISSGVKIPNTDIDTGNIKFIAHGLDYSNQLSKFDALGLPDSDALLSVSYMERPESKFRLFRTQGVLLDVDSNYIYGGGETDSGSGCEKSISDFINNYAYQGAIRHGDREFISKLIKNTLNLDDEEYLKFIQENKDKSFQEIEPKEVREKLIKAFGVINSQTRRGGREYNEMYVSNPKVMGVFAYPKNMSSKIGDTMKFVGEQKEFLRDYALNNDVPMVIFGE